MLTRLGDWIYARVSRHAPHTNVYGTARTVLALGTLGTLVFSDIHSIFRPAVGLPNVPTCVGTSAASLYCVLGGSHLELARVISIIVVVVVASGWRPRYTALPHWYVVASLFASGILVDGGDQITSILALLIMPVALTDPRKWHWDPPRDVAAQRRSLRISEAAAWTLAFSCLFMIRLQVAGVYFQAAVSKMRVNEWRDGTAVYYWFTDPWFGFAEPLRSAFMPVLASAIGVSSLTWGAMMLEIFLFAGLIADKRARAVLLWLGLGFHLGIAVVHGLLSFALAMWCALVLYLRPVDREFVLVRALTERLRAGIYDKLSIGSTRIKTRIEGQEQPVAGSR